MVSAAVPTDGRCTPGSGPGAGQPSAVQGAEDMPNLFALTSDESDHPTAGDKLRGNDEGRTGGLEGEGSPEGLVFPLSPDEGAR